MPITWSDQIPTDPRGQSLPLKRTPPGGKLTACVTSDNLLGCDTHFYKGATTPCTRPECDACRDGMPFRWHGYLAAIEASTRLHFIFEFTAQAADSFDLYRRAHGTLRGCIFNARRLHGKPNGRVMIETKTGDLIKLNLPDAPLIQRVMAIIWNLPKDQISTYKTVNGRPGMTNTQNILAAFNPEKHS